ncbi:MAG TPA: hypothetical protein VGQ76_13745, partial [Thermoanaerobaculia bacterium]|nr:hypothetical protein [Thermoanaerobaculia bacterium]
TPSQKAHVNHAIVYVRTTDMYYDPSYGLTYTDPADFETKALDGYYDKYNVLSQLKRAKQIQAGTVGVVFVPSTKPNP